ncbi:MAG TPA: IS982 family transposase [Chloroflexota bacterium]|nr:IS982 family transposase [Chloroflexota bacterium]
MNDDVIVAAYVVIDEAMGALGHRSHRLARLSDAEVLTVAVVAAAYFQNHHERALQVLWGLGYLSARLSTSRFSRRLHALRGWLGLLLATLGELFARGAVFLVDSLPVPACRRARARRCGKLRGRAYCGYCAAKREKFFGWRLHLVCDAAGVPVAFELLPGGLHDLTPIHELSYGLPAGACVYADKAYNSKADEASILADTGVRLVPLHRANMAPNLWGDKLALRQHRQRIETTNSQLAAMGLQRLHARTVAGVELKVLASLLALVCINAS